MLPCEKHEFDEHVAALDAVPEGFGTNGGYAQTRFYSRGQEVARVSQDSMGTIYEIQDFECPLCGETFGNDAIHNDDNQLVCPHCAEVVE